MVFTFFILFERSCILVLLKDTNGDEMWSCENILYRQFEFEVFGANFAFIQPWDCHMKWCFAISQTGGRSRSQRLCLVKMPGHWSPLILLTDVELCQLPNMYPVFSFPPLAARLGFCPYLVRTKKSRFVPRSAPKQRSKPHETQVCIYKRESQPPICFWPVLMQ